MIGKGTARRARTFQVVGLALVLFFDASDICAHGTAKVTVGSIMLGIANLGYQSGRSSVATCDCPPELLVTRGRKHMA
ncbi:hypothetical protein BDZ88DRAFT_407673 [Geranomyces variabilis]|nr:hypothetical protein BDZ88DRAFT_407673 [Geranomyces variabilis]